MQSEQPNFYTINSTVLAHQLNGGHADHACHCLVSMLNIRNINSDIFTPPPPTLYLSKLKVSKFNKSGPVFRPVPVFCVLVRSLCCAVEVRVFLLHSGMCSMHVIPADCKTANVSIDVI